MPLGDFTGFSLLFQRLGTDAEFFGAVNYLHTSTKGGSRPVKNVYCRIVVSVDSQPATIAFMGSHS